MNRTNVLSLVVVIGGIAVLVAGTAQSQVGPPKAFVSLQPTTPGTSQSGHSNISGTSRAGQFVGGGSGLTNVNANLLDGLDSTAFGRTGSNNAWTGNNNFSGVGNIFVGNGLGLTQVDASRLDGLDSTDFLQAIPNPLVLSGSNANAIVMGSNSDATEGAAGVLGVNNSASGLTVGVYGRATSLNGRGVFGEATNPNGTNVGGRFSSAGNTGLGVYGLATGGGSGVRGESTGPGSGDGIQGFTEGAGGTGVYGLASSPTGPTIGVSGFSSSTLGKGVSGVAGAATGDTKGVYGQSTSDSGAGVYGIGQFGVEGRSSSTTGRGVYGMAIPLSGSTYGVYGESSSVSGTGVFGLSEFGIEGQTLSTTGRGVFGRADALTGATYGVRGACDSPTGYGVYSLGNIGASGVKSFRIDHPFDPANKYLLHYSSESPFPQNFYSGNVVTDQDGYATVELPDYFAEINTNFKYQLTVMGKSFAQAIVWEEIKDNQFLIRTNSPNVKVSWRVECDRNDKRMETHRPTDVADKIGIEKGKYQHPEQFGQAKELGMDYKVTSVRNPIGQESILPKVKRK